MGLKSGFAVITNQIHKRDQPRQPKVLTKAVACGTEIMEMIRLFSFQSQNHNTTQHAGWFSDPKGHHRTVPTHLASEQQHEALRGRGKGLSVKVDNLMQSLGTVRSPGDACCNVESSRLRQHFECNSINKSITKAERILCQYHLGSLTWTHCVIVQTWRSKPRHI